MLINCNCTHNVNTDPCTPVKSLGSLPFIQDQCSECVTEESLARLAFSLPDKTRSPILGIRVCYTEMSLVWP